MTQAELAAHYDRLEEAGFTKESMNDKEIQNYFDNCSAKEAEEFVHRQAAELKGALQDIRRNEAILRASGEPVETYYFPGAQVIPATAEPQPQGAN